MKPELLSRLVNAMADEYGSYPANMGSVILDPKGKPVGVWYSFYRHTAVRFEPDNVIAVSPPPDRRGPLLWDRDERPGRFF
jgi:hypothetical protein